MSLLSTKSWFPSSAISISDLENIDHIKIKPYTNSDGDLITDPCRQTMVTYLGFDGEEIETLFGYHPLRPYVLKNPESADQITCFKINSFKPNYVLKKYHSALIEYLSFQLNVEWREDIYPS